MNAVFGTHINRSTNQSKMLAGLRIGSANELNLARNIFARVTKLPAAIAHLVAGPPMSEKERCNQRVAEARARNLEGLASAWFRPR